MSDAFALTFALLASVIATAMLYCSLWAVVHFWPLWLPVEPLVYGALGCWIVYCFICIITENRL